MEIKYDNYKEWPLYIEFLEPDTLNRGTKRAYPSSKVQYGGFFHPQACICHPCSRKAYDGHAGLHKEWDLNAWRNNPQVGSLINLKNILCAIYHRISNPDAYGGRMHD